MSEKEYDRTVLEILDRELDKDFVVGNIMIVDRRCKEIVVDRCAERDYIPLFCPDYGKGFGTEWLQFQVVKLAPPC